MEIEAEQIEALNQQKEETFRRALFSKIAGHFACSEKEDVEQCFRRLIRAARDLAIVTERGHFGFAGLGCLLGDGFLKDKTLMALLNLPDLPPDDAVGELYERVSLRLSQHDSNAVSVQGTAVSADAPHPSRVPDESLNKASASIAETLQLKNLASKFSDIDRGRKSLPPSPPGAIQQCTGRDQNSSSVPKINEELNTHLKKVDETEKKLARLMRETSDLEGKIQEQVHYANEDLWGDGTKREETIKARQNETEKLFSDIEVLNGEKSSLLMTIQGLEEKRETLLQACSKDRVEALGKKKNELDQYSELMDQIDRENETEASGLSPETRERFLRTLPVLKETSECCYLPKPLQKKAESLAERAKKIEKWIHGEFAVGERHHLDRYSFKTQED